MDIKQHIIFVGGLKNDYINQRLRLFLFQLEKTQNMEYVQLFITGNMSEGKEEFLCSLPVGVTWKLISLSKWSKLVYRLSPFVKNFSKSKCRKWLNDVEIEKLIYFAQPRRYYAKILSVLDCDKEAYLFDRDELGLAEKPFTRHRVTLYLRKYYEIKILETTENERKELRSAYQKNRYLKAGMLLYVFSNTSFSMRLRSIVLVRTNLPAPISCLDVIVGDKVYTGRFRRLLALADGRCFAYLSIRVPQIDMKSFNIHNKVKISYTDEYGESFEGAIKYREAEGDSGRYLRGPIQLYRNNDSAAYFRQSAKNLLYLTVRRKNLTDSKRAQRRMNVAALMSYLFSAKDRVLLFEKESSRYEESASILFERMIDEGVKDVYFVLNSCCEYAHSIDAKYSKFIISKGSFKHYLYFFQCKTFIGTETLGHVVDLRVANRFVQRKLSESDLNYVFLQHGVTYMISLNSKSRTAFAPLATSGKYRVVVSSEKEKQHFINFGNHQEGHLYMSGMPKFDRCVRGSNPDRIAIMLTWRPWEYNTVNYDFEDTKYYKTIERIFESIPSEFHENVEILPHPLFTASVEGSNFPLKRYLNTKEKYDDILKNTELLITDYSSIAYDAFYRGCKVVFYWEEKEECLINYGESTQLMLTEEEAFGEVFYDNIKLNENFSDIYLKPRKKEHASRFKEIVSFNDGKNTDRLIALLKMDGII